MARNILLIFIWNLNNKRIIYKMVKQSFWQTHNFYNVLMLYEKFSGWPIFPKLTNCLKRILQRSDFWLKTFHLVFYPIEIQTVLNTLNIQINEYIFLMTCLRFHAFFVKYCYLQFYKQNLLKPVFMIPLTLEKLCAFYISKMQKNRCIIKGLSIYLFFFFW